MTTVGCQMDLSDSILDDMTPDRVLKGVAEEDGRVGFASIQHQVEGSGSGIIMALLSVLQGVSPETPEFWGAGCDLEPMVANEEEIVRTLLQPSEM